MAIYLVYRLPATEVGEQDRPFVADLSLMKVTNGVNQKTVEIQTLLQGSKAFTVTDNDNINSWTGEQGNHKFRAKFTTLESKNVAIGLVTHKGSKTLIDTFFAEEIAIDLDLPNVTYGLTYAWEKYGYTKNLKIEPEGTDKKRFIHHHFADPSNVRQRTATTPGKQAAGRFNASAATDKLFGWAIPFQGKTALVGFAPRPSGSEQGTEDTCIEPGDPVEPFVAIAP